MKVELQQQWKLLDLQKLDTRLDQIAHRLNNPPQAEALAQATRKADLAAEEMVLAQAAVADVDREMARSEADVQQVRDRADRNQKRLDAGQGTAKDLQALQHELETLARRQRVLEDAELEIMERAEGLRARAEGFAVAADEQEAAVKAIKAEIAQAASELEAERTSVQAKRDALTPSLDQELLSEYESLRPRYGIAAAGLQGRRCLGCGLELNQRDLAAIKAQEANALVYCPECSRILVRTAESDL